MKKTIWSGLCFFSGMFALLALTGCHSGKTAQDYIVSQNLTVETVADTIIFTSVVLDSTSVSEYEIGAESDSPTDGPQSLTDSVRQFIIRELYSMFDWGDVEYEAHIPFEKVCEWKGDNIVSVFLDNYSPLLEKEIMGNGADYLSLKLVAQTETFITYYGEHITCGAGCHPEYCYYTFRKQDGALLKEIASEQMLKEISTQQNLKAFLKKFPQYKEREEIIDATMTYMGLNVEGLKCHYLVISDWPDYYDPDEGWHEITIPYSEIKPYLSKQVQELILDN